MDTKHDVLKVVSGKISDDAYCSLTQMNGFQFPNDEISVIQIIRCIEKARFPTSPKYEYAYAINACGQDDLRRVDPRLLYGVSAIFLYCNKRKPLGAPHECEFLRNMIVASVAINEEPVTIALLMFLRALSKDLNDRSAFQELFALVAMAYVLRQFGIAVSKEDHDMLDVARKKMPRAHPVYVNEFSTTSLILYL